MKSIKKMSRLQAKKRQCILYLNEKYEIASYKGYKSLVSVDTETNINLKIVTQKIDVINQSHNVIKDISTLTRFCKVLLCNLFSLRLLT